jgi:nucleosome binding factor SPN SPT16 subunit
MVGKRNMRRTSSAKEATYLQDSASLRHDIEEGAQARPQQDRKYRFRDQEHLDPDDQRRVEFKKKLLDAVESGDLESFRKTDDEVPPLPILFPSLLLKTRTTV